MSRYKAYSEYKGSGVEWLGNLPCDWDCVRLKFASELSGEKVTPSNEERYVGLENVQSNSGKFITTEEVIPEGISNVFSSGDVLFGKLRPYLAKSWLANFSGICSSEFLVMTSRKVDSKFLNYFTLTEEFIKQVDSSTYGSKMPRASWEFIGLLNIPIPSYESEKIAAFLDHETAKIDALIDKQQRLIELLKEKRQAVISHAVTKGLNPNAPMKDSGVEWLGEVPAHWVLMRVKFVCSFTTSGPRGWSELVGEAGSLFIQSGDLSDTLSINFAGSKRVQIGSDAEAKRTALCNGDVVVCITGAKTGNVALCDVVPEDAYINQHLCLIRPSSIIASAFLAVQLKSSFGQTYFELSQYGLKHGLSLENVREAPVHVPPLTEQSAIVSYLDAEAKRFDVLIAKAQHSKELLQERRTALISAAVTGKIDVRDWQPVAVQEGVGVDC